MSVLPVYVTDPETFVHLGEDQFICVKVMSLIWDKKRCVLIPSTYKADKDAFLHMEDTEQIIRALRSSYEKLDSDDLKEMSSEFDAELDEDRAKRLANRELSKKPVITLPAADEPSPKSLGIAPDTSSDKTGNVYLLGSERGECKIGKAKELSKRITQIALQLPYKVNLIHSFPARDYDRAERALHQKFADKRANGEWFQLDENDIAWIKSITEM